MSNLPVKQNPFFRIRNNIINLGLRNRITRSIMVNTAPNIFGYNLTNYVLNNDDSDFTNTMELFSAMHKTAIEANILSILRRTSSSIKDADKLINMILDATNSKNSEIVVLEMLDKLNFTNNLISDETYKRLVDSIDCSNKTQTEIKKMFESFNKNTVTAKISYKLFENLTLEQKKEHFSEIIPIVVAQLNGTDYSIESLFSAFPAEDRLEQYKKILEIYKIEDSKSKEGLDVLSKCFQILPEQGRISAFEETFEQIKKSNNDILKGKYAIKILGGIPAKEQEKYFKEILRYIKSLYQIYDYVSSLDESLQEDIVFDVINITRERSKDEYVFIPNEQLKIINSFKPEIINNAFISILNGNVDNPNIEFVLDLLEEEKIMKYMEVENEKRPIITSNQLFALQQKGYNIDKLVVLYISGECNRILNNYVNNLNKKTYMEAIKQIDEMKFSPKFQISEEKKLDTCIQLFSNVKSEEKEDVFLNTLDIMFKDRANWPVNGEDAKFYQKKVNELFSLLGEEAQISQFPILINYMTEFYLDSEAINNLIQTIAPETMDMIYSEYIEMFNNEEEKNYSKLCTVLNSNKFVEGLIKQASKKEGELFLTEEKLENILNNKRYSPHEYFQIVKIFVASRLEKIKNEYNNLDENGKKENVNSVLYKLSKELEVISKSDGNYENIINELQVSAINEIFLSLDNEEKSKHFDTLFKALENIKSEDIKGNAFVELFRNLDNNVQIDIFKYCTIPLSKNLKYVGEILSRCSAKELNTLFKGKVILDEKTISKLITLQSDIAIKTLLFDKDVDREKLVDLSTYDQLQTDAINIDTIIKNLYLNNQGKDKKGFNQALSDTYNLFTYNNVPEFMKNFRMFQLGSYHNKSNNNIKSFQDKSNEERDILILEDLFKISLDSNNVSLRDFSNIIIEGKRLTTVLQVNPEEKIKALSKEELALLSQYRDTLVDLHNITKEIKNMKKPKIEKTDDIIKDLRTLISIYSDNPMHNFNSKNIVFNPHKIMDELFKGFITTTIRPKAILEYMDRKKVESDSRHLEIERKLNSGIIHLQAGDFVKGIQNFDAYIPSMLRDGIKGGEFNQEHSHSDATPLDADFGYVSNENIKANMSDYEVIKTTCSGWYGENYIVLKQYADRLQDRSKESFDQGTFTGAPDYYKEGLGEDSTNNSRYIRTGIPISDVDYIVSENWNQKNGYEMAMAGIYIPVIDKKGEIVFSSKDYMKIRGEMKGLSHYNASNLQVSQDAKNMEALYSVYRNISSKQAEKVEEEIELVRGLIEGKADIITEEKKKATTKFIKHFFKEQGIRVTNDLSQNLSSKSVELIDTGSTGRGTNVPGDGDFDFMLRHNLQSDVLEKFSDKIEQLPHSEFISAGDVFRAKDVKLPTGEIVDIDITTAKKSLALSYSSDMCVRDRLNNIRENDPENYNYVRANIIMAKKILKEKGIYKKIGSTGATKHGGFGGIGVENWILQNGGSFKKAIDTFLETAKKVDSYDEFKKKYPIFDFGFNHKEGKIRHDCYSNFFANDTNNPEIGFAYAKNTLAEIQKELELEKEKQEMETPLLSSISPEGFAEAGRKKSILRNRFSYSKVREMMAKYMSNKENLEVQAEESKIHLEDK